jgi:hypothetical protein
MAGVRFIGATQQRWKLALPLGVAAVAGLLILTQGLIRTHLGTDVTRGLLLCATLVAFVAFAVPCFGIRCPRCHAKLFWQAVRTQHSSAWLFWLLSISQCPRCSYTPEGSERAV